MVYEAADKLGNFFCSRRERGIPDLPTLSVTLTNGLVPRDSLDRKMETNLSDEEHLLVRKDDIVYNTMRMWQGASGLADRDGLLSPAYVVLAPKKGIDPLYASYLFKSSRFIYLFWAYSYGLTSDRLRLYFNDFKSIPVNILPLPEQIKTGNILSTWDKAIEKLEALIAAKQKRKKALMQQLLTGKKRFTGFEGEWKWIRFDQILDIEIGGTPSRNNPDYWDKEKVSKNRWLSIRDMKGHVIEDTKEYITDLGVKKSNVTLIPAGSIVMSFKLTIGRAAILGKDCYTNEAICSLIPKDLNIVVTEFLIQALDIINFEQEIDQAIKGKTLNKAKLGRLKINLPLVEEQQKIASVLSATDTEIETHQKQLSALKEQKKGLMQQLLTGKKRVRV